MADMFPKDLENNEAI